MDWTALMTAFAGGIWGAAVGAVPAFIFTGVLAMLGLTAWTFMRGGTSAPAARPARARGRPPEG